MNEQKWLEDQIKLAIISRNSAIKNSHENQVFGNFVEYLIVTNSDHSYECGTAPVIGIFVGIVNLIVSVFAWTSVENNNKSNIGQLMIGGTSYAE